ncbi:MAG TPA: Tex-like N-terminal domain-containing protein, partial [Salinimicrobium sp.]|nr:Tex-like N-terminal domain-containing protein [Salinimicrobium sp.]
MEKLKFILSRTGLPQKGVANTLKLFEEDATIPFISRYRKEMTGNLDEVQIGEIAKYNTEYDLLEKRKKFILKSIEQQEALNAELRQKINATQDMESLEDLYLPFKKKRKTRADNAREKGLGVLADILLAQQEQNIVAVTERFLGEKVKTKEVALSGARDIAAEKINEDQAVRIRLRRLFSGTALISAKRGSKDTEEEKAQKYKQYFNWEEKLKHIPSHRLLALLRAEKEDVVKLKISVDKEEALRKISAV